LAAAGRANQQITSDLDIPQLQGGEVAPVVRGVRIKGAAGCVALGRPPKPDAFWQKFRPWPANCALLEKPDSALQSSTAIRRLLRLVHLGSWQSNLGPSKANAVASKFPQVTHNQLIGPVTVRWPDLRTGFDRLAMMRGLKRVGDAESTARHRSIGCVLTGAPLYCWPT